MSKKKITGLSPGLALVKMNSGKTKVVDTVKAEFLVSKKLATIVDTAKGEGPETATMPRGRRAIQKTAKRTKGKR